MRLLVHKISVFFCINSNKLYFFQMTKLKKKKKKFILYVIQQLPLPCI